MTPDRLLHLEMAWFLYALAGTIAWQLLTRQINTRGLFTQFGDNRSVSPGRIQLLLTTLIASASFLSQVAHATDGSMPDISPNLLYVFGGSGGIYALEKAWAAWQNSKKS